MGVFHWQNVANWIHIYSLPVMCVWLGQWILALGFSRFARWRARNGGGQLWARRTLLPAYEAAIVFKKIALLALMVSPGFKDFDVSSESASIGTAVYCVLTGIGLYLYSLTYVIVLYVLCAHSAGTSTIYRSVGLTLTLSLVMGAIWFFEFAGWVNEQIQAQNTTTVPLWPSFGGVGFSGLVTAVPGIGNDKHADWQPGTANVFWLGALLVLLGLIATILVCTRQWRPRQLGLATALYALFMAQNVTLFFSQRGVVVDALSFTPYILVGVVEMPLKYWVMLCDSNVRLKHPLYNFNSPLQLIFSKILCHGHGLPAHIPAAIHYP